ncbi:ABC transporter substrate-binding protein [Vreelandella arcis]|uniref:ABC transporter substrate-binding protein n=1 Tax=Vreelandella arcis TaxID=416873 RepID=UPI000B7D586A|nr:ABC transporter substrate-binding protein [Halomonas arcis]
MKTGKFLPGFFFLLKEFTVRFYKLLLILWCPSYFFISFFLIFNPALANKAPSSTSVFDWTVAEALLALDPGPVLMGNVSGFHTWTGNSYTDADITSVGSQIFPNMELLSSIGSHRILLAPRQTRMGVMLADIAPFSIIHNFPFANDIDDDLWARFDSFVLEVGALAGRRHKAEKLVANTQVHLRSLQSALEPQPPLLIIQLMNEQYMRVYGENSLFQGVLKRLGLSNAWKQQTNQWGYSLISIRELFNVEDARLVIIESGNPTGIEHNIENSGMWRYLPSVQRGDFVVLPSSFWIGGVHPSARRFADALVEALEEPTTP